MSSPTAPSPLPGQSEHETAQLGLAHTRHAMPPALAPRRALCLLVRVLSLSQERHFCGKHCRPTTLSWEASSEQTPIAPGEPGASPTAVVPDRTL